MQNATALPANGAGTDAAAATRGLPGFTVFAAGEYGGELELLVETTESVTGCPDCGVVATLHDRRPRWVRDLPAGGRPVVLVWFKRVWRCGEEACPQRTWSERSEAIRARAVLTERARAECARRVGQDATSVAQLAAELGVGWGTVMRAVWEYGQRILDEQWLHTNVAVLGLDETAFLAGTPAAATRYVTGLVDPKPAGGGPARLLDVVEGRSDEWSATGSANVAPSGAPGCRWPPSIRSAGCQSWRVLRAIIQLVPSNRAVALALRSAGPGQVPASRSAGRVTGEAEAALA